MKRNLVILTILLTALSLIPAANGQENDNTKENSNGIKPVQIELADEAAIVISGVRITIADAIKTAIEKNHDILSGKYDVAMTDSNYRKYQTKYSTFLSAEAGVSTADYPDQMVLSGQYPKSKTGYDFSAAIMKMFSTGTTVTAGIKNTYSDSDYPTRSSQAYNPVIFASIEQELLQNSFGYNERREQQILKDSAEMQRKAIIYQLSLVVVNVIVEYWNVIVNKTELDNAQLMLQETKKVRRIVSDNVKLGLAEQFELNLWNSLVASAEAQLAQAQQKYDDSLRSFLRTVDMKGEISVVGRAILSNRLPEINTEESIKIAYTKRVDYLNAVKMLEIAEMQLDLNENDALPSLKGSLTVSTMDYNTEMGTAYGNTTTMKYPSYEARVKMTYPLDNQNQEVNERNSRWQIEQARQDIRKYERLVKDDVTSKIENINTTYKLYLKAKEAREQAEIYYRKMSANLRRGRFTASTVREALDALIMSREGELKALVYFNVSLLQFEVSKNQLFETYKIDVEKYIPKE